MNRKDLFQLFKASFKEWREDNAPLRAAALTFFIILPLPSLLLIVEGFYSLFVGQTVATQQVIQQITSLAGPAVAGLFNELLLSASSPFTSFWAAFTVAIFSLAGAIGTFAVLRDIMDVIWEVKFLTKRSLKTRIKEKIWPFFVVSFLGLIVLVLTGIETVLFHAIKSVSTNGTLTQIILITVQILLSFGLSTLLFAIAYKMIPERIIHWKDISVAAVATGIAFTATNYILGTYIQIFTITTILGAAGALLIILIWIYILNQIVLFGAEISKVYATTIGPHPMEHSLVITEKIVTPLENAEEIIREAFLGKVGEETQNTIEESHAKKETSM